MNEIDTIKKINNNYSYELSNNFLKFIENEMREIGDGCDDDKLIDDFILIYNNLALSFNFRDGKILKSYNDDDLDNDDLMKIHNFNFGNFIIKVNEHYAYYSINYEYIKHGYFDYADGIPLYDPVYCGRSNFLDGFLNAEEGGETTFYYLKLKNKFGEDRFKIGVTIGSVKKRYGSKYLNQFEVLYEKKLTHAKSIEKEIKNMFNKHITDESLIGTTGTEIFNIDILEMDYKK